GVQRPRADGAAVDAADVGTVPDRLAPAAKPGAGALRRALRQRDRPRQLHRLEGLGTALRRRLTRICVRLHAGEPGEADEHVAGGQSAARAATAASAVAAAS